MDQAATSTSFASTPAVPGVVFEDGLGERRHVTHPQTHDTLEVLCLRGELTSVPVFEFALRERANRLAGFRHACYGRVRSVERLNDRRSTLALVSDWTPGVRLSEILAGAERSGIVVDFEAALCLIRQLAPAVAMLHEKGGEVSHGALGPERIVVTPNARLVIVEHVLGAALERLRFSHDRYWKELRIPLPSSVGLARFDERADVMQLGVVALSVVLGRPLHQDECPPLLSDLLATAGATSVLRGPQPLPTAVRTWLVRALQLDAHTAFMSAAEACSEFDRALGESGYMAEPAALEKCVAQCWANAVSPSATKSGPAAVERVAPAPVAIRLQPASPPPLRNVVTPQLSDAARSEPTFALDETEPERPETASSEMGEGARQTPERAQENEAPPAAKKDTPPAAEEEPWPVEEGEEAAPWRRWVRMTTAAVVLVAAAGGGVLVARRYWPVINEISTGTLVVDTNPSGAQTLVDGEPRGITPLTLTLKAGAHVIELNGGGEPRKIPITIASGAHVSQYIELPKVSLTGRVQIRSDPPGAEVTVDGAPLGTAPLTVGHLTPGSHTVVLANDLGAVTQTVAVEEGGTSSLVVAMAAREDMPVSGWISVSSPVEVQLFEDARLLGSSQSGRIMLPPGSHRIDIVSDVLGYRTTQPVQVQPGKAASISVKLPTGTIDLNATPWAEVWIDGKPAGETPLGNVPVTIGPHEVIFRNPDLGEQRHSVTVTATAPARLSVDLRKP